MTNELTEYAPDWMDGSFDAKPGGGWYKAEDADAEIERLRNIVNGCPVCSELARNIRPSREPEKQA